MKPQEAYDALLGWCSEIGSGDIDGFRSSCRHLNLHPNGAARVLSELGHVEFDWQRGKFAAAPTTLTTIPGLPGRLLLTGARPYGLIAELADLAEREEFEIDVSRDLRHQFGRGPATALIDGDPADAAAFCEVAGISFAPAASSNLSELLPPIRVETSTIAYRPDPRFPHALVDPDTFEPRWDQVQADAAEGLWLYRTHGRQKEMILRFGDQEPRRVLDPDYGPYLMKREDDGDPIVEYAKPHRVLVVNAAAPLPALHARCACLCSGRLPVRQDPAPGVAFSRYVNVDPQTADRILDSLGVAR